MRHVTHLSALLVLCLSIVASSAADMEKLKVLVVTGGHGFEAAPFFDVFESNKELTVTRAAHAKDSSSAYDRKDLASFDCVVMYDMVQNITDAQKANILSLTDKGVGLLVD